MNSIKSSELVETTVEVLEDSGWCQGEAFGEGNSVCLMQALGNAYDQITGTTKRGMLNPRYSDPAYLQAKEYMLAQVDLSDRKMAGSTATPGTLAHWNDIEGRTVDEVKDLLMKAAKHFRNEGK